jgi:hypothetical protein
MQAPEQKRDAAHQIEKNEASHGFPCQRMSVEGSGYRHLPVDQILLFRHAETNLTGEWFEPEAMLTAVR